MINALRFPNLVDNFVIMGIIKKAVAKALIVENQAGQVPAAP
jgi:hypothetical protein